MTKNLLIRPLSYDDLAFAARLEERALEDAWNSSQLIQEFHLSQSLLWGAFEQEHLAGYVCAWWVAGELEILRVATDPEFRRRGVASRLVHALVEQLQQQGLQRVLLEVRASNTDAQAFYQSQGFVLCGKRSKYYKNGETALLMEWFPA